MAATYDIEVQYPTVEFLGGTRTKDVVAIGVRTRAHAVYFETRLDKSAYTAANVANQAGGFTAQYEKLFDIPGVVDVQWAQQPTPSGYLEDHVIVYYETASGNSSGFVDIPYSKWTPEYAAAQVAKERKALTAAEAA